MNTLWKNVLMREDMLHALEKVVQMYYEPEKKHCEEWGNCQDHIFHDLDKLAQLVRKEKGDAF
jgi:hypothetical protein